MAGDKTGAPPAPPAPIMKAVTIPNTLPIKVPYEEPKNVQPKKRYWFGTLPGHQSLDLWFPKAEKRSDGDVWSAEDHPVRWVGKCAYLQNIGVNGIEFDATQDVQLRDPNNERVMVPYPGVVDYFDDARIERIKKAVARTMIRISEANADEEGRVIHDGMVEGPNKRATIIMLQEPDTINDKGETIEGKKNEFYRFNARTDTPAGKYVYLVEVDKAFTRPDLKAFFLNPPPPMIGD